MKSVITNLFVLASFTLASGLMAPSAFAAQKCGDGPNHLSDFLVYSAKDITVERSDYQGTTGAHGEIIASNFLFENSRDLCLSLSAGGPVHLTQVSTTANFESGSISSFFLSEVRGSAIVRGQADLSSSKIDGTLTTPIQPIKTYASVSRLKLANQSLAVNHDNIVEEMFDLSYKLANLPSNAQVSSTSSLTPVNLNRESSYGQSITLNLANPSSVITLSGRELSGSRIVINGSKDQQLVMNISGQSLTLHNTDVLLIGGIGPAQITWNFYAATSLEIDNTKNPSYGIPGTVLAPLADVQFYEGRITGALYVGNLSYDSSQTKFVRSGQVNDVISTGTRPYN